MKAKKRAKRRERHRRFPPMVRIVGGELPAGLVLSGNVISGVAERSGSTTVVLRIASGPTDFREREPVPPMVAVTGVEPGSVLFVLRSGLPPIEVARFPPPPAKGG